MFGSLPCTRGGVHPGCLRKQQGLLLAAAESCKTKGCMHAITQGSAVWLKTWAEYPSQSSAMAYPYDALLSDADLCGATTGARSLQSFGVTIPGGAGVEGD